MTTPVHPIDHLLDQVSQGERAEVPDDWGQGRATFGGLVAALLTGRALAHTGREPIELRHMTTSFVAPVNPGPARVVATTLRAGSSATQARAEIHQGEPDDETLRATALLSFGAERSSGIEVAAPDVDELPDPAGIEPIPYIPDVMPGFFGHVELRAAEGSLPYSGVKTSHMKGFMRFRQPPSNFGLAHLVALIDAWPPATLQMSAGFCQASTLTWSLELLTDVQANPEQFWWYDVRTDASHHGYAHTHATIHDHRGKTMAISRQTISVFDQPGA